MIKLLITEDHPMLAEGLIKSFETIELINVIGVAYSGKECIELYQKFNPDIVMLDLKLPDNGGEEIAEQLFKIDKSCKIIVFTSHNQQYFVNQMVKLGVKSYLLKTCSFDEIVKAIFLVSEGENYYCREIEDQLKNKENKGINISKRESEVLRLIAKGLTNTEIAENLFISPLTVDSHRKNLIIKFNVKNTASLISEATSKGYL